MPFSIKERINNGLVAIKASSGAPFIGPGDYRYDTFMGITNWGTASSSPMGRIEIAQRSIWVYALTMSRVNAIKDIPLKLRKMNDNGVKEDVLDHPINDLLADINPEQDSPSTFRTSIEQGLTIHGRSVIKKVRNKSNVVKELYSLPGQFVRPIPKGLWIGKFLFEATIGNEKVKEEYDPENVIYFRYQGFDDGITGLGPLSVAMDTIQVDLGITASQGAMIRNSGRPSVIITTKNKMNDSDYKRESERAQSTFGGAVNAGKIWLIDNADDTKITPVQLSPKDLAWIEQHSAHINDLCAAFKVPPGIAGEFEAASRIANAGLMHRNFGEVFVLPELRMWESIFNWQLLWSEDWGHGLGWERKQGMFLEHDLSAVPMFREDDSAKSARALSAFGSGGKLDEIRAMHGFNPVGGTQGNTIFIPSNVVPLKQILQPAVIDETPTEYSSQVETKPKGEKKPHVINQAGSNFTDETSTPDMQYAKSSERKQYKKWIKKHDPAKDTFEFKCLTDKEQRDLMLEDEIRNTLSKINDELTK
jgi:HK97 family phage portal protein